MGLNCFFHQEKKAVVQCNICGKGLCRPCVINYRYPICLSCYHSLLSQNLRSTVFFLALCIVLFIVGYKYLVDEIHNNRFFNGYMLVAGSSGWKFINSLHSKRTERVIVVSSDENGFANLLIKLLFSALIGIFAAPFIIGYSIFKVICSIYNIKKLKKRIRDIA